MASWSPAPQAITRASAYSTGTVGRFSASPGPACSPVAGSVAEPSPVAPSPEEPDELPWPGDGVPSPGAAVSWPLSSAPCPPAASLVDSPGSGDAADSPPAAALVAAAVSCPLSGAPCSAVGSLGDTPGSASSPPQPARITVSAAAAAIVLWVRWLLMMVLRLW